MKSRERSSSLLPQNRPRRKSSSSNNNNTSSREAENSGTSAATSGSGPGRSKPDRSSVKSEPLEGSAASYYSSSHISGAKSLQDSSSSAMLHGLPQLTPAPFSSHHQHYHQGFSINEDVKYHSGSHHSSLPYTHHGYGSFHSSGVNGANSSSMLYTGLPEHSTKLNLQPS